MDADLLQKDKADLAKAKHCATGLLQSARITEAPISIRSLIDTVKKDFDITFCGVPDRLFNGRGDAMTEQREGCFFLIYNQDRAVARMRFSVAHELGHLYVGHFHGNSSIDLNSKTFDEIEANTFAAHLLMPPKMLRADIKMGIKSPEELAKKYQVSLEAMWYQILGLGLTNSL